MHGKHMLMTHWEGKCHSRAPPRSGVSGGRKSTEVEDGGGRRVQGAKGKEDARELGMTASQECFVLGGGYEAMHASPLREC